MSGNVEEWCSDWYGRDYYKISPKENPKGPETGTFHEYRGGSYDEFGWGSFVAMRSIFYNKNLSLGKIGFRLVKNY